MGFMGSGEIRWAGKRFGMLVAFIAFWRVGVVWGQISRDFFWLRAVWE